MKGFEALFGRYAPGGDCAREPRVVVDATGIALELKGVTDKSKKAGVRGQLRRTGVPGQYRVVLPVQQCERLARDHGVQR